MTGITQHEFEGSFKWVRKDTPNKWGKYSLSFYPKDAAVRKAVKETGIRNSVKEDDDGFYYDLRSDRPYPVVDASGDEISVLVGNGSSGGITLTVETFQSAQYGLVTRSNVAEVCITNLIPYERPAQEDDNPPAQDTPVETKKGKRPF